MQPLVIVKLSITLYLFDQLGAIIWQHPIQMLQLERAVIALRSKLPHASAAIDMKRLSRHMTIGFVDEKSHDFGNVFRLCGAL